MLPERAYFENVRGILYRRIGSRGLRQEYRLTDLANKPIEQYLIRKKHSSLAHTLRNRDTQGPMKLLQDFIFIPY